MRFRFVIALMLLRKKRLKLVEIGPRPKPDGEGERDALVLRETGRGGRREFEIADVKMSEEEMIAAQDEVGTLLAMSGVDISELDLPRPGEDPPRDAYRRR